MKSSLGAVCGLALVLSGITGASARADFPKNFEAVKNMYRDSRAPSEDKLLGTWKLVGLAINPQFAHDELGCARDQACPDSVQYNAKGLKIDGALLGITFTEGNDGLSCTISDLADAGTYTDAVQIVSRNGSVGLIVKSDSSPTTDFKECRMTLNAILVCGTGLEDIQAEQGKVVSYEAYVLAQ
jgi:hypothetical protein